jgi:hypothetical protein
LNAVAAKPRTCSHCGVPAALENAAASLPTPAAGARRYDLEQLVSLSALEKAYDETVKIRVNQQDVRKLVEKRRGKSA